MHNWWIPESVFRRITAWSAREAGHVDELGSRQRRPGGGRQSAVAHQPGLPAALEKLIEDAIRGDPCRRCAGSVAASAISSRR